MNTGPSIFRLTQRLAETPSFIAENKKLKLTAVISDLLFDTGGSFLNSGQAEKIGTLYADNTNLMNLVLITCYLLHDNWFLEKENLAKKIAALLIHERFKELAKVVRAKQFITDPERREELARLVLDFLDLTPEGETENKAKDRLTTLDSVERVRLIEKTRKAQERAKQIREEMARKEAEEAASKMSRE